MTQFLPPNLLALFAPRDPIPFIPPIDKHAHHRKLPYNGIAQFLGEFEDPSETPPPVRIETRDERKERKRREKQEQANYKLEQDLALWNPKKNPKATPNAYNTMFIGRLNYDTTESKLKRELEQFGRVNTIALVKDITTGKSRGYAFVEFEHERDMHAAVKSMNGRKIDGMRAVTDIERGRTRADWRPKRLGKGLGRTRHGHGDRNRRHENGKDSPTRMKVTSGREHGKHHSRSRSRSRERRRSRSRDRHRKRKSPEKDRDHRRKDRRKDEMFGEYGSEIRAEYNSDS